MGRLLVIMGLVLGTSCNVFYALDNAELAGSGGTTSGGTTGTTPDPLACGTSCTCDASCARVCDSSCDATCEAGTCDIDLQNAGDVTCVAGTDCIVNCERGDCFVNCEAGAACSLRCGPHAGTCEFSSCSESPTTCPGKTVVCGARC